MPAQQQVSNQPSRLRPFVLWLVAFYGVWLTIVIAGGYGSTLLDHWPIAVAMSFGSFIAGSTPMGGGTVGFPVLVLLFDQPASLGRNFALAIQSVGMVSATIYIFCLRTPLEWKILRPALVTVTFSLPLSAAWIAPTISDFWVKIVFAVIWASFGLLHLVKLRTLISFSGLSPSWGVVDRWAGVAIGLLGGMVVSLTGVGIDMILYTMLVLLYRADLKIAIPTSVVIMAYASVVGIVSNLALAHAWPESFQVQDEVFANWLAAAPIVALGAPLGALVVARLPRLPTLVVVSLLCVGQFLWTCGQEGLSGWPLVVAVGSVLLMNAVFHLLFTLGDRHQAARERRSPATTPTV